MVLQSSGAIKFSEIQSEFGGSNPIQFSEYYKDGSSGYVVTDGISDEIVNANTPGSSVTSTNSDYSAIDSGPIYGVGNNSYSYVAFKNKAGNSVSNYTLTFSEDTKCDVLIVGGGGSGGARDAGAGGAGGIILLENQFVTTAEISVGKGGNAVSGPNHANGNKGQNSTFQITTGGGGSSWNDSTISNFGNDLVLWHDGKDVDGNSNSNVPSQITSWHNKSSSSFTTTTSSSYAPSWDGTGVFFTDYDVLTSSINLNNYSTMNIFVVYKPTSNPTTLRWLWGQDNGGYDRTLIMYASSGSQHYVGRGDGGTAYSSYNFVANTTVIVNCEYNTNGQTGGFYINNSLDTSFSSLSPNGTTQTFFGAMNGSAGEYSGPSGIVGNIYEIIIIKKLLTSAERLQIYDYLNEKWINGSSGGTSGTLFTAEGGGKGGAWSSSNNNSTGNGGSGGGGGGSNSAGGTGNQSTSSSGGYGNNGAQGSGSYSGGGGGGAGGPGTRHSGDTGGDGGIGMDFSYIFGSSVGDKGWFGGGGGSGSGTGSHGVGGVGGGGNGASGGTAESGIDGTGGGGGANRSSSGTSGKGGDGIVILRFRYKTTFFYQQTRTAANTYVIDNQDNNIILKTQNITFNNGKGSNGTDQTMEALILEPGEYRVSFYEGYSPSNNTDQVTIYLCTPNGTGSYIKNDNSLPLTNGFGAQRGWQPYHHQGSATVPDIPDYNFTINSKSAVVIHTTGTTGWQNTYGDYNNAATVALYDTYFKSQYDNIGFPGNDSYWSYVGYQGGAWDKIKIIKYGHPSVAISLSEFFNKAQVASGPPTPVASSIPGPSGGLGNTGYEIITGLYANNTTRSEGTTSFDNRGATGRGSSNNVSYSNLIIQAKPGDTLNLIGRINTSGYYKEYCEFWVWLGGSWSRFTAPNASFSGNRDFSVNYTIPSSTSAGNYALAVACSYYNLGASTYRSWKSYSLHVWT